MASGSFNLSRTGSTSSYITFKCSWSSTPNQATNKSTVTVTVTASKSSSSTANTYGTQETKVTVGSSAQSNSGSFTLAPGKTITLFSKSYTVAHESDGTKSVKITANVGGNVMYGNGSATVTLDKIPRYATVTQSNTAKTETTATIKWSSDATVDYIWYSTNNGSSWTGINVADGTSGTYTINGLNPNTTYQVKTRVRRKDSQLTTDSSALAVTTYAYPYANSMPSFTIGNKLTIGLYNPLNRSVKVNIIGADDSQISDDTTSGTSITGYNGSVVVGRLYDSIPNSKYGTYRVRVTYGSNVSTATGGRYTVNENDCKPSIGTVSYADTNASVITITGSNQDIVRNHSTVSYTATGLSAQKGASVSSCSVTINGETYNLTISGTTATGGNATIDSGTNVDAVFTVTDSRGVTATKTCSVNMLDWQLPSAIITLQRQHNFYTATDLTVDAMFSSINGNNTITISYACTKDGDTSPTVTGTCQDNVLKTIQLDNTYAWAVKVTLTDRFNGTTIYNLYISRGMPIIYFDRLKRSIGVNCFPQDEESIELNGVNLERSVMTRSLSAAITDLAVNTYTIIPFDLSKAAGGKLTAVSGGGIRVGANVSKVLVSGMCSYDLIQSNGSRHIRIIKNSYTADNTLAWSWQTLVQGNPGQVEIMPILADVTEGDIIYMVYYTGNTDDKIGGNSYGCRTSITVQTVE